MIAGLFIGSAIFGVVSDACKDQKSRYGLLAISMALLGIALTIIRTGTAGVSIKFLLFMQSFLFYGCICMWYRVIMDLGKKIEIKHNIRCLGSVIGFIMGVSYIGSFFSTILIYSSHDYYERDSDRDKNFSVTITMSYISSILLFIYMFVFMKKEHLEYQQI
jgi:MFS family permease